MIRTQEQLARLMQRSRQRIGQWIRDSRWTFGPPPWPDSLLPAIRKWAARLNEGREPALAAEALERIAAMTQAEYEAYMAQFFVSGRDRERIKWRRLGFGSWAEYVNACARGLVK